MILNGEVVLSRLLKLIKIDITKIKKLTKKSDDIEVSDFLEKIIDER